MSISKEQAIKVLEDRKKELESNPSLDHFRDWKAKTLVILTRIYGTKSFISNGIAGLAAFYPPHSGDVQKAIAFLDGALTEIESFGLPAPIDDSAGVQNQVNVHQQQQQQQSQIIELAIELAIKELPKEVVEEIRQIVKEGGSKETILQKVRVKLNELGTGVAASSLATILIEYFKGAFGS